MAGETQLVSISAADLPDLQGKFAALADGAAVELAEGELKRYGEELVGALKENAPVRTGELRDSIRYEIKGSGSRSVELVVTAGNEKRPEVVVKSLLFGSLPHIIRPKKRGGVLAFKVGNEMVFARQVKHPGTARDPFFNNALRDTDGARRRMIARIGSLIVDKVER